MTCRQCELSKQQPGSGLYNMACLQCCTRLVLSTHPNRQHAAGMLACVERHQGKDGRARVAESVRQALEKRH